MYDKKAFCKGVLCRQSDRKFKSVISKKMMCGSCSIPLVDGKYCTVDELVTTTHPAITKTFKDLLKDDSTKEVKVIEGVTD